MVFAERLFRNLSANTTEIPKDPKSFRYKAISVRSPNQRQPVYLFLYPLLFGIYPLISLWAANLGQVPPFAVLRSLLFALGLLAVTYPLCLLIFRRLERAALAESLFLVLFYSFGQVFLLLKQSVPVRIRFMFVFWILILIAGLALILRARRIPPQLHTGLTIVALFLAIFPGIQILSNLPKESYPKPAISAANAQVNLDNKMDGPDVYYILIDNHSRSDLLQELGLDNSAFLQSLTDLGFNVDPCAQSNYDNTHTSMVSVLNMNYIDKLDIPIYPDRIDENTEDFAALIQNSVVRAKFESLGYQIVTFSGVYPWLNIHDSDIYYDPEATSSLLDRQESINLQAMFFRTTLLLPAVDWLRSSGDQLNNLPGPVVGLINYINPNSTLFNGREYLSYRNNLYAFDRLAEIPKLPGKKFVYAHIFPTHVPFVFNADGSFNNEGLENVKGYLQSVQYTDTRILEIVKTILRDSPEPPVIVLQADHGFVTGDKRVRILNALYLPGAPNLHQNGMTPVNTFRLIFSQYFGANYGLLPDQSYVTAPKHAYIFNPVPPSCAGQ